MQHDPRYFFIREWNKVCHEYTHASIGCKCKHQHGFIASWDPLPHFFSGNKIPDSDSFTPYLQHMSIITHRYKNIYTNHTN